MGSWVQPARLRSLRHTGLRQTHLHKTEFLGAVGVSTEPQPVHSSHSVFFPYRAGLSPRVSDQDLTKVPHRV